jgi:hypothetical protein
MAGPFRSSEERETLENAVKSLSNAPRVATTT